ISFFLSATYHIIENNEGSSALRFPILAMGGFILHQTSVVLGILTIIAGANKGREYGEMPWFSDAMFSLSLLLGMLSMCFNLREKESLSKSTVFAIAAIAGIFITHLLGNISFPYWFAGSVLPFNGIQDASAQEFYRMGVLGFYILLPVFAALYYFIPSHFNTSIYSEKLADFQLLTMIILIPLSGAVGLVFSPAPQLLQTFGIIANGALAVSILAGGVNLYYTMSKSNSNPGDSLAKIFKIGTMLMIVYAVIRGLAGLRIVQDRFGLTWWNPQDISIDASLYALPLIFGGIYLISQKIQNQKVSEGLVRIHMMLMIGAFAVIVAAAFLQGSMSYYNLSAVKEDGALELINWSEATFLAGSKGTVNLISFHGLAFAGYLIMIVSLTTAALNTMKVILSKQS
ncbi:MAG: cbb3-type cytochrome c oxidase subunit I, partial [Spirochaetia bacterium]|nr:cbb3-type cytochrome c oxidase subunit I [Spirochaetia bacterium]